VYGKFRGGQWYCPAILSNNRIPGKMIIKLTNEVITNSFDIETQCIWCGRRRSFGSYGRGYGANGIVGRHLVELPSPKEYGYCSWRCETNIANYSRSKKTELANHISKLTGFPCI